MQYPKASSVITAAIIATTARLFMYLLDPTGGIFYRHAVSTLGLSVVVLEITIVVTRFFTSFWVMKLFTQKFQAKTSALVFITLGMISSFLATTVPKLFGGTIRNESNPAYEYLSNRPFQFLPVFIEYATLYALESNVISVNTSVSILCTAIMFLIVAMHQPVSTDALAQADPQNVGMIRL